MTDQSKQRAIHCDPHATRLCDILRHDRVTVLGTAEGGIVQYADDSWALVYLDNGYELTCSLDQIRWAGQ
jgi:hypothetical protein